MESEPDEIKPIDVLLNEIDALLRLTHEVVNMKQYATDDITPIVTRLDAIQSLLREHQDIPERTVEDTKVLLHNVRVVLVKLKAQPVIKQWLTSTRTHAKLSTLSFRLHAFHNRLVREVGQGVGDDAASTRDEDDDEEAGDGESTGTAPGGEAGDSGGAVDATATATATAEGSGGGGGGTFSLRPADSMITPRPAGGSLLAPAVLIPGLNGRATALVSNVNTAARNRLRTALPPLHTVAPPPPPLSIPRILELRRKLFEAAALIRSDEDLIRALQEYVSVLAAYHRAVAEHGLRRDQTGAATLERMQRLSVTPARASLVRAIGMQQRGKDEAEINAHIGSATIGELQQWSAEIQNQAPLRAGAIIAELWEKARAEFKSAPCPLLPADGPWTVDEMHRMLDDALFMAHSAAPSKRHVFGGAEHDSTSVTLALATGTSRSHHFVEKFSH